MTKKYNGYDLSKEEAEKILDYNPETGVFIYKISTNNRNKKGGIAGSKNSGYLTIMYKGKNYSLHRIVFLLEDGKFPDEQIDHINGNRGDNRRSNLRKVTHQQNCWNKKSIGACRHKKGKYVSYVDHDGKRIHLGYFKTREQAMSVSLEKKKYLREEYVRE